MVQLKLISWNMQQKVGNWQKVLDSGIDAAMLQEAIAPPDDLKDIFINLIGAPLPIENVVELLRIVPGLNFEEYETCLVQAPEGFEALWEAMAAEQAVEMLYLGGSAPGATRVITPLGVTRMGSLFYLSAFCHKSRTNKTYRLDRIVSYRKLGINY